MPTLEAWLDKIATFHPQSVALGLERIGQLAKKLQITQFDCPVVMIGGTNGKGSCVKYLETILTLSGYQVGAYTSPHLLAFNERIRLNNANASSELLVEAFEVIDRVRQDLQLTFFEFTTLAALWIFKQAQPDVILLEVGVGGRLDAVNIVDADIAIITSIDLDHTEWLGNTRQEIAFEKAGIFRSGSGAVIGDEQPPTTLLNYAEKNNTKLYRVNQEYQYFVSDSSWSFKDEHSFYEDLPLPKLPIQNAATALKALNLLAPRLPVSINNIKEGLQTANLLGRFQFIEQPYPTILDVAHNPASAKLLATKCQAIKDELVAVVGMLADKDIINTLAPFKSRIKKWYFGSLHVPRGTQARELALKLENIDNQSSYTYDCVTEAYEAAGTNLVNQQRVLVFGSFYTVAEILQQLVLRK
jgi:dihydrofolate synthase/folylpolyglutamate synthase